MSRRTDNPNNIPFSDFLRKRRQELGITIRALEQRTGIHNSRLSRWERGIEMPRRPEIFTALAESLQIPVSDVLAAAGIEVGADLPTHRLYLRSKYGRQLPAEALSEIAEYADRVAARYGTTTGPAPGEDET